MGRVEDLRLGVCVRVRGAAELILMAGGRQLGVLQILRGLQRLLHSPGQQPGLGEVQRVLSGAQGGLVPVCGGGGEVGVQTVLVSPLARVVILADIRGVSVSGDRGGGRLVGGGTRGEGEVGQQRGVLRVVLAHIRGLPANIALYHSFSLRYKQDSVQSLEELIYLQNTYS